MLTPAVEQVNRVGHIALVMETRKKGRSTSDIRFLVRQGAVKGLPVASQLDAADEAVVGRLKRFGLAGKQLVAATEQPADRIAANLDLVEANLARGAGVKNLSGYALSAITDDWAASSETAAQTQAELFPSLPAPSPVTTGEMAREERERQEAHEVDGRIAALSVEALAPLDVEVVEQLRESQSPFWKPVADALESGTVDDLSPSLSGLLKVTRRERMALR